MSKVLTGSAAVVLSRGRYAPEAAVERVRALTELAVVATLFTSKQDVAHVIAQQYVRVAVSASAWGEPVSPQTDLTPLTVQVDVFAEHPDAGKRAKYVAALRAHLSAFDGVKLREGHSVDLHLSAATPD